MLAGSVELVQDSFLIRLGFQYIVKLFKPICELLADLGSVKLALESMKFRRTASPLPGG